MVDVYILFFLKCDGGIGPAAFVNFKSMKLHHSHLQNEDSNYMSSLNFPSLTLNNSINKYLNRCSHIFSHSY